MAIGNGEHAETLRITFSELTFSDVPLLKPILVHFQDLHQKPDGPHAYEKYAQWIAKHTDANTFENLVPGVTGAHVHNVLRGGGDFSELIHVVGVIRDFQKLEENLPQLQSLKRAAVHFVMSTRSKFWRWHNLE